MKCQLKLITSTKKDGPMGRKAEPRTQSAATNRQAFLRQHQIDPAQVTMLSLVNRGRVKKLISAKTFIWADGLISDKPNHYLGLLTADCIPLVVYSQGKNLIALVHVGWRDIVFKTIKKTLKKFPDVGASSVFGGPAICSQCYTSTGLKGLVKAILFYVTGNGPAVSIHNGRYHFDLRAAAKKQLLQAGINKDQIDFSNQCTVELSELYPSHVREGEHRTNSLLTIAGLDCST